MAKKAKKKEIEPIIEYDSKMVLYSDGGSRGPGYAGWGVHGYIYNDAPIKKGNGNPTSYLTSDGYVLKRDVKEKPPEVKAINYIDSFGSFSYPASNNAAEVAGAYNAFNIANKQDIKELILFTDSKYVVNGATSWLPKWKSLNFVKTDGSIVANKNEWLTLDTSLNTLKEKGVDVDIRWVKGHSGNQGNDLADKGATMGVMHSRDGKLRSETDIVPSEKYWSVSVDVHPFLNSKRAYFSTRADTNIPGEYYLGYYGTADDFIGKKQVDGNLAYVELKEPDELLELVKSKQIQEAHGQDLITMLRLDKLYTPAVAQDLLKYGDTCIFRPSSYRIDLDYIDAQPLTKGLVPPRLAMRAISSINELKGVLLAWRDKSKNISSTQITSLLFEKDKKQATKLKSEFASGIEKFSALVKYNLGKGDKEYKLDLFFTNDMPDRNIIKRLEKLDPKVYCVTWMESEKSFRYAVIIEVQNGTSIWSSISSNLKFIK